MKRRDRASVDAEIDSLWFNLTGRGQLGDRLRRVEKLADVMDTPLRRKILFMLDGWPLFRLVDRPQWRPWRRWWTS